MTEQEQPKNDFMHKLALQIVERRNLVFLIVILGAVFTIFSRSWVKVESDLTTYLPKTSETRMGLDIMEKEFTTYGSADVMVANITPDEADRLNDELAGLRGIQMIEYDDTTAHYNNVSALYSITFDYPEDDDQCLETLESVKEYLKDYDIYVSTSLGNTQEETIEREVNVIMVYVAIIIVVVLIFTSQTYAEVPVLLLTFVVGMILNMGTNFLLGTISFVSNSVTNILQLALSLDYAIIFCNHFKEEHETLPLKEAVIESLAKSHPGDQFQLPDHHRRSGGHAVHAVQDRPGYGHLPDQGHPVLHAVGLRGHARPADAVWPLHEQDQAPQLCAQDLVRGPLCLQNPQDRSHRLCSGAGVCLPFPDTVPLRLWLRPHQDASAE